LSNGLQQAIRSHPKDAHGRRGEHKNRANGAATRTQYSSDRPPTLFDSDHSLTLGCIKVPPFVLLHFLDGIVHFFDCRPEQQLSCLHDKQDGQQDEYR